MMVFTLTADSFLVKKEAAVYFSLSACCARFEFTIFLTAIFLRRGQNDHEVPFDHYQYRCCLYDRCLRVNYRTNLILEVCLYSCIVLLVVSLLILVIITGTVTTYNP